MGQNFKVRQRLVDPATKALLCNRSIILLFVFSAEAFLWVQKKSTDRGSIAGKSRAELIFGAWIRFMAVPLLLGPDPLMRS